MPGDPLFDTFFRPTSAVPPVASALPVRAVGTRSRGGNAMSRTRVALLEGARRAVATSGSRITMAQVAASAGVAKATLYNHFRTREAVLAALLEAEVGALVTRCAGLPLEQALLSAGTAVAEHPLARALARIEPATLTALATVDERSPAWRNAAEAVEAALTLAGRSGSGMVLRWLATLLVNPAGPAEIAADAAVLAAGLPGAGRGAAAQSA